MGEDDRYQSQHSPSLFSASIYDFHLIKMDNSIFRAKITCMKTIPPLTWICFCLLALTASSCIPIAAGAAAGYVARDQGYEVQSPVEKKSTKR
jgi:hypothetical protein